MCLSLPKNYQKRIAETDIICYKHVMVLTYIGGVPDQLVTSYQVEKAEIGKAYESEISILKMDTDAITVALHSFKTKKACIEDVKSLSDGDYAICRCIIPKGSEYYVGKFGNAVCYASDKIRYEKILKIVEVYR